MSMNIGRGYPLGFDISTAEIQDNSVTGEKIAMGSDAQGDVLYYDGTNYVRLPKGTATKVLAMNAGATAPEWITAAGITEESEVSSTPITPNIESAVNGNKWFHYVTLPTTEMFYKITGIEWKNGGTVSGKVRCGVSLVNADPPSVAGTSLLAMGNPIAQTGTSAVQRNSAITSQFIRGGSIIGVWVDIDNATGDMQYLNGQASVNYSKTWTYAEDEPNAETTAWNSIANRMYIKVYYKGYS